MLFQHHAKAVAAVRWCNPSFWYAG